MSDEERAQVVDALGDDGTTVKTDSGHVYRLRVEADQDTDVSDFDCYGRIGLSERDRHTGRERRPDGFDGGAEKLSTLGGEVWWQPPSDMAIERGSQEWRDYRYFLSDLVSYGFKGVVLERLEGTDAYGRPIVVDVASLWGIDSLDNGYLAYLVGDLYEEIAP
jgi:hypothetical protein